MAFSLWERFSWNWGGPQASELCVVKWGAASRESVQEVVRATFAYLQMIQSGDAASDAFPGIDPLKYQLLLKRAQNEEKLCKSVENQKNPRAHKNKIGTSPPQKNPP